MAAMSLRHDFYETDEKITLSIYDKGALPEQVSVKITESSVIYQNGEKSLVLEPLKGRVDPKESNFSVGKVKIEVRLAKTIESQGRWHKLIRATEEPEGPALSAFPPDSSAPSSGLKPRKNWEAVTDTILKSDKEKTISEDPNAGGDGAVNGFFQKIYADADEDTRRAMMKSYVESGGTTLSTNWQEVGVKPVEVKPPEGSEWKKWG